MPTLPGLKHDPQRIQLLHRLTGQIVAAYLNNPAHSGVDQDAVGAAIYAALAALPPNPAAHPAAHLAPEPA